MKITFVAAFLLLTPLDAALAARLTFKDALASARLSSPERKRLDLDYRAAVGAYQVERSFLFPTIGIEGGYQKFDSDSQNISGTFANIFGEYKFDLGGSQYFQYKAASLESKLALTKKDQSQKLIEWSIETKFSHALYLQESVLLYQTALDQNKAFAQLAQKKKASGLASEADVIEFDLHEALLRSDLEDIKSQFSEAMNNLRAALGRESMDGIELQGSLEHFHISDTLEVLKSRLKSSNYKFQLATLESEKAAHLKSASYSGFLPELLVRATYGRRGMDEPAGPEETVFVIARWELFSGLRDLGAYHQAVAVSERAQLESQQAVLNLSAELGTEYKKFLALQNRVDLESQNKQRAKKYLNTVMNEYRRGVKNSADLKAASTQLLETSLRDLKYRFEGIRQKEVLQSLVGDSIRFEAYTTDHKIN